MEVKAPQNTKKPQYPTIIKTALTTAAAAAAALAGASCQQWQQVAGTYPDCEIKTIQK